MVKRNKGFTLIELVIVIVLLGILAATALPKFSNLTVQARRSAADGVAGALAAAASIVHAQWLASGASTAAGAAVTLEGTSNNSILVSPTGWPECVTCGTTTGVATAAKCVEIWNTVMNNPPVVAATTCTGTCQYLSTATGATCSFQDQQGTGTNTITYNVSTGGVVAP